MRRKLQVLRERVLPDRAAKHMRHEPHHDAADERQRDEEGGEDENLAHANLREELRRCPEWDARVIGRVRAQGEDSRDRAFGAPWPLSAGWSRVSSDPPSAGSPGGDRGPVRAILRAGTLGLRLARARHYLL